MISCVMLTLVAYKTCKIVNRLEACMCRNLYFNHVMPECQITNKINKGTDNANIDLKGKKNTQAN